MYFILKKLSTFGFSKQKNINIITAHQALSCSYDIYFFADTEGPLFLKVWSFRSYEPVTLRRSNYTNAGTFLGSDCTSTDRLLGHNRKLAKRCFLRTQRRIFQGETHLLTVLAECF